MRAMTKPKPPVSAPVSRGRKLARRSILRGAVGLAVGAGLVAPGRGLAATGGSGKLDLGKLHPYWNEVPDSAIAKVFPKEAEIRGLWGVEGPNAVINDWCGAAWSDSRREMILAACGGHGGYFGNEVYVFSRDTLSWTRARDPSPIKETQQIAGKYPLYVMRDGPVSRHTYNGLVWAENAKRVVVGGAAGAPDGNAIDNNWLYDPVAKAYEPLPARILETMGAYDPERRQVICVGEQLRFFDVATRAVTKTVPLRIIGHPQFGSCDYDPDRKTFVYFNDPNVVVLIKLAGPAVMESGYALTPDSEPELRSGGWSRFFPLIPNPPAPADCVTRVHGVAYHPPSRSFVCWGGGRDVIRFDHRAMTFTRLATPAGQPAPSPPTGASVHGVFGRWRYMADIDAFMGFATPHSNMWIYKAPA
jgi:hypothetical protein